MMFKTALANLQSDLTIVSPEAIILQHCSLAFTKPCQTFTMEEKFYSF